MSYLSDRMANLEGRQSAAKEAAKSNRGHYPGCPALDKKPVCTCGGTAPNNEPLDQSALEHGSMMPENPSDDYREIEMDALARNVVHYSKNTQMPFDQSVGVVKERLVKAFKEFKKSLVRELETAKEDYSQLHTSKFIQVDMAMRKIKDVESAIDGYIDGAPDASPASKLANEISRIIGDK